MKPHLNLASFNEGIQRLGYNPIAAKDLTTLVAVFGEQLAAWLASCLAYEQGRGYEHHALKSALFAVSGVCWEALLGHGIDMPPLRLAKWLVQEGEQGRKMIRRIGDLTEGAELDQLLRTVRAVAAPEVGAAPLKADIKARTMKARGSKYALTVEQTWDSAGQAALQVEMAKIEQGEARWADKIAVQLADHEVVAVLNLLAGRTPTVEFSNHGTDRKQLRLDRQQQGFYVNVRRGADSRGVLVPGLQSFRLMALALRVVSQNNPGMTAQEILQATAMLGGHFAAS